MSNIENMEQKCALLMQAFDEPFREDLRKICKDIEKAIKAWIESAAKFDERIDNVFSIQSRVKGILNFKEKLYRKNYIKTWNVSDNKEENQEYIKYNLTDLIGIRVNCYFSRFEQQIYDYFRQEKDSLPDFEFNFDENTQQKNGHKIYKFSGKYKGIYQFEIQIKSVVHNVWGEVEHKTVYKNPNFDGFIGKKKELTESLHHVLFASDNQLFSIFNMKEDEGTLIESLFFYYTKDNIKEKCETGILAKHYENYFRAFTNLTQVKHYIAKKLENQEYEVNEIKTNQDERYKPLISRVLEEFPEYYIKCLYNIDSVLNSHDSYEDFVQYFVQSVISLDDDDEDFSRLSFSFNGEEDLEKDPIEDYLNRIDEVLGNCRLINN